MKKFLFMLIAILLEITFLLLFPNFLDEFLCVNGIFFIFMLLNEWFKRVYFYKHLDLYRRFVGNEAYHTDVWGKSGDVHITNKYLQDFNGNLWYLPMLNIYACKKLLYRYYCFLDKEAKCYLYIDKNMFRSTTLYKLHLYYCFNRFDEIKLSKFWWRIGKYLPLLTFILSLFQEKNEENIEELEEIQNFMNERGYEFIIVNNY